MRSILIAATLFAGGCMTQANAACQTDRLVNDLTWCLIDGPPPVKGRDTMLRAIDANRADALVHYFAACQDSRYPRLHPEGGQAIGNALACFREDRQILLKIGRQILSKDPR